MREKRCAGRGETLVEALASILICTLSVTLLFGAVTLSVNLDRRTRNLDETFYQDFSKAERQGEDGADDYYAVTATLRVYGETGTPVAPDVRFYGTERLLSYALPSMGGDPTPP